MTRASFFWTLAGFVISPLASGLLISAPGIFVGPHYDVRGVRLAMDIGYPVALVFGVPAYFLLLWRGWVGLGSYAAAGALLGLVPFLIALPGLIELVGVASLIDGANLTMLALMTFGAACGVIATMCFWFIARPDRVNWRRAASVPTAQ